jgi:hypothetical protein
LRESYQHHPFRAFDASMDPRNDRFERSARIPAGQ